MNTHGLNEESLNRTKDYLSRKQLGADEELQMLSTAYARLFLSACENKGAKDLASCHELIADCFEKLGDTKWETRHRSLAKAYDQS